MQPNKVLLHFLAATLLLLGAGCEKERAGQTSANLVLRHKGADMPIWVRGNLAPGKLVLFLHGGPGECGMCLREFLEPLEADVAMVYWDQRIAGAASGVAKAGTLTYPQFAEDLEMVVRLLKRQYPGTDIYLFGHSFGVEMAWQFLTTGDNQTLVRAFVALNGAFSTLRWLTHMREWILRRAREEGDAEAAAYMLDHPVTRENMHQVEFHRWYPFAFRLGANPVWPTDDKKYVFKLWFATPHSKLSQLTNVGQYDSYYAREIFTFERTELLQNVRIPVALFWGALDGIIPIGVGLETQSLLVNAPTKFVRFEDSWHTAFHTEGEKFRREMLAFLEEN